MKTLSVFLAISFIVSHSLSARTEASDNDTVWLESPKESLKRDMNRIIKNKSAEIQRDLVDAAERLRSAKVLKSSNVVSSLASIIDGLAPMDIILTESAKKKYLGEMKNRYFELQDQYDHADTAIMISNMLQKLLPFYLRDRSAYDYLDSIGKPHADSIYKVYLRENGPEDTGRYYYMDWLWLKLHNKLPEFRKKEEIVQGYSEPTG